MKIFRQGEARAFISMLRGEGSSPDVSETVRSIINDVRRRGDEALREYTYRFDGADLSDLCVTEEEINEGVLKTGEELTSILRKAAENITAYHRRQVREGFSMQGEKGTVIGQRILPLERVGIYVPGGRASYPSTVLMNAIPASIAGVKEIVMVTPPRRDGTISPNILCAASIAGVTRIFKAGGAQAVAALAYGTESIPAVDKITGPGNQYVATAKRMVFGKVDIDMIAGPSEVLIIADDSANPAWLAADLLAQAEHDPMAQAALICTSPLLGQEVAAEVEGQLRLLPGDTARRSIESRGARLLCSDINEAVNIANAVAPEHLELAVRDPWALLPKIQSAGSVFLGHFSPEPLGDYFAGPNHTLPTGGTARFASPLSVDDFVKKSSYIYYPAEALQNAAGTVAAFARSEGLEAHARSAESRLKQERQKEER